MRFIAILGLVYGCAVAPVAHASLLFDDFNDGNDAGWTRYDPLAPFGAAATFSFPGGGYRIQAPTSPLPGVVGPGRAGGFRPDTGSANFLLGVDLVGWDDTLEQGFGLVARGGELGLGTGDGYWMHYITRIPQSPGVGALVLDRIDNEIPLILGVAPIKLDPTQDYRLVFTGVGTLLTGQIFSLSDLTIPLVTLMATDSAYTSGVAGLLVSDLNVGVNGPADATFDNFQASSVAAPSGLALFVIGMLALMGGRRIVPASSRNCGSRSEAGARRPD